MAGLPADFDVAAWTARTREEQGLPPHITDPQIISEVAGIYAGHLRTRDLSSSASTAGSDGAHANALAAKGGAGRSTSDLRAGHGATGEDITDHENAARARIAPGPSAA